LCSIQLGLSPLTANSGQSLLQMNTLFWLVECETSKFLYRTKASDG
jgi:hypothetical protein